MDVPQWGGPGQRSRVYKGEEAAGLACVETLICVALKRTECNVQCS